MDQRPGEPADAVLGVRPARVVVPASIDEAAAVIAEGAGRDEALAFVGGGTELELGAPPRRLDTVVRTERLARLIEYAPSDQIVTVEAGMTLGALAQTLAGERQRLALDPPEAERKTIGGVIATSAFGPLRTRFGAARDLIIGASFVRADGTRARGGGKVVKNVAGFDLPKLLCGSLGTLGMVASATFRLHPLPETSETLLLAPLSPAHVWQFCLRLRNAQVEPSAVIAVLEDGDRAVLALRYEGFQAGVAQARDRTAAQAREQAAEHPGAPPCSCEVLDPKAARGIWEREARLRSQGRVRARMATQPSLVSALCEASWPELSRALGGAHLVWYPMLGLASLSADAEAIDVAAAAAALAAARSRLESQGGSFVLCAGPPALRERFDVWGARPAAFSLMQRIKARFDPAARLNPGRFVGGL